MKAVVTILAMAMFCVGSTFGTTVKVLEDGSNAGYTSSGCGNGTSSESTGGVPGQGNWVKYWMYRESNSPTYGLWNHSLNPVEDWSAYKDEAFEECFLFDDTYGNYSEEGHGIWKVSFSFRGYNGDISNNDKRYIELIVETAGLQPNHWYKAHFDFNNGQLNGSGSYVIDLSTNQQVSGVTVRANNTFTDSAWTQVFEWYPVAGLSNPDTGTSYIGMDDIKWLPEPATIGLLTLGLGFWIHRR